MREQSLNGCTGKDFMDISGLLIGPIKKLTSRNAGRARFALFGWFQAMDLTKGSPSNSRSGHEISFSQSERQVALLYMRNALVLLAVSMEVCGCNQSRGHPELELLAHGLAQAWQPVSRDMKLDIRSEANGNHVTLHCVLRNLSTSGIEVDQETIPWNNPDAFSVSAVAVDGKVFLQNSDSAPAVIARISAPHAPIATASGQSLQGIFELALARISAMPRTEELLLNWSYPLLKEWRTQTPYPLSGITLLTASAKDITPVSTATELNFPPAGTSVAPQKMMEDLRAAPETLAFDKTIIRLLAFPVANRMPMAISRDPNTGMSTLDSRPINISFRLISEQETPLPSTLHVEGVWVLQDGQIWSASAIEETVGASNGSSRDFLIHDGPHWRSGTPVDVVVTLRDEKGALYWLAARHQRISAVE